MEGESRVGETTNWYVIHVHSGQEQTVKDKLERLVAQRGMSDRVKQVFLPSEEVAEVKSGRRRVSTRKFFPGYLLVQMNLDDELWYLIRSIQGVSGFIGSGRKPVAIPASEVEKLMRQVEGGEKKPKPKVSFEKGEKVKVIEGPFANFIGTVDEVNPERGKLKVWVEIFERMTSVELEFWQVERV